MKPYHILVLIASMVAPLVVTASEQVEKAGQKMVQRNVEEKDIRLSVALPEKCVAGTAMNIVVSLKNQSTQEVAYSHISKYRNSRMEVHDSEGKPVPMTRFGNLVIGKDPGVKFKVVKKVLAAGKEIEDVINLSRVFDLTIAGDYTLTVTREINEDVPDKAIRFRITEFPFTVVESDD